MKIGAILKTKGNRVHSISPQTTLKNAVKDMLDLRVGSLLVVDASGAVAGIFTERDLLRNLATLGAEWEQVRVGDVMTRDLIFGSLEDTVEHVMTLMTERRIRHLPIMDESRLIGMLSMRDIIESALNESKFQNQLMKRYIKQWPESE